MLTINHDNMSAQKQKNNFKGYNYYNSNYKYSNASKTKKIGVGVASFAIPGLGQIINNETSKGIAMFIASLSTILLHHTIKRRSDTKRLLSSLGIIGIRIWSAIDAYKRV